MCMYKSAYKPWLHSQNWWIVGAEQEKQYCSSPWHSGPNSQRTAWLHGSRPGIEIYRYIFSLYHHLTQKQIQIVFIIFKALHKTLTFVWLFCLEKIYKFKKVINPCSALFYSFRNDHIWCSSSNKIFPWKITMGISQNSF